MDDAIVVPASQPQAAATGPASQRIYVVAGMHRAGTSVMARALQALGIDLGERLMSADVRMNARGFFEDLDMVALDDALLALHGADWKSSALLAEVNFGDDAHAELRERAHALLQSRLARTREFAFKDPRVPRVLPFWQAVFRRLGASDAYVIAVRHPLSVIESLTARDQLDARRSGWLWLTHLACALHYTHDRPRVVVDYDRLLGDPRHELARIASAFERPMPTEGVLSSFVDDFLSAELRHARHDPGQLDPSTVPPLADDFHRLTQRLAHDDMDVDSTQTQVDIDDLFDQLCRFGPLLDYAAAVERVADDVPRLSGELRWARASLEESGAYAGSLQDALKSAQQLIAGKDAAIATATAYSDDLAGALKRKEAELVAAHATLARVAATVLGRMVLREVERKR